MAKAKPKAKTGVRSSFSVRLSDDERAALAAAAAADNREAASLARLYILAALKSGGFLK